MMRSRLQYQSQNAFFHESQCPSSRNLINTKQSVKEENADGIGEGEGGEANRPLTHHVRELEGSDDDDVH